MTAISSLGSFVKVGPIVSGAYSAPTALVGELVGINLDGMKLTTIDVSTMTDRHRRFAAGMIDSGSISIEVNYDADDAQQVTVLEQLDVTAATTAPVLKSWLVSFGTATGGLNVGSTFACIGFVTDFSVKGSMDTALTASITVKISGSVDFTDVD